jgi:hypothetical protein
LWPTYTVPNAYKCPIKRRMDKIQRKFTHLHNNMDVKEGH